jgi:hypothetical protein
MYLGTANWLPSFTKNDTLNHTFPIALRVGRGQECNCQEWQTKSPQVVHGFSPRTINLPPSTQNDCADDSAREEGGRTI